MEFSAQQIAALAGGVVEGDGSVKINTILNISTLRSPLQCL